MSRLVPLLCVLALGSSCFFGDEVVYTLESEIYVYPTGGAPGIADTACGTAAYADGGGDAEDVLYDYDSPTAKLTVVLLPGAESLTAELRGQGGAVLDSFVLAADALAGTENTLQGTSGDRDFTGTFVVVTACD